MYYRIAIILIFGFLLGTIEACSEKSGKVGTDAALNNQLDSVAYTIGMNFGANLKKDSVMIDIDVFAAGLRDALYGDSTLLTEKEATDVMRDFQMIMQAKQQESMLTQSAENKAKGDRFLQENKNKPGVKTTESGLQYIVIKEGTGKQPTSEETVKAHYHGTLLDGTVFDSSVEKGEPVDFLLNRVIPGWTEGVQLMKEGAKYKFFIPGELAYGQRGAPPQIGANETLIFEIELLEIVGKK